MVEPETKVATTDNPFAPELPVPRPSILHVLLWVLCSGICLTLTGAFNAAKNVEENRDTFQQTGRVFQGILQGTMLTGIVVLGYVRYRYGPPLLKQPGHWLLLMSTATTVAYRPLEILIARGHLPFLILVIVLWAIPSIVYLLALRRTKLPRWRDFFLGTVVVGLLHILTYGGRQAGLDTFDMFQWLVCAAIWGDFVLRGWVCVVAFRDLVTDSAGTGCTGLDWWLTWELWMITSCGLCSAGSFGRQTACGQ